MDEIGPLQRVSLILLINELENNKRGIYGDDTSDTWLSIYLAFKKNGKVFMRSGAGVLCRTV
ncbi:MAG: hypothetical protein HUJ74_00055 [Lachnospiraceae bacterium]|nr:hypothetical protein [Lachnospiraceae bacterium]